MMKRFLLLFMIPLAFTTARAAEKKTDVKVDVGSMDVHEGAIVKVVPSKKEIYIEQNGKKYEYYFKADTQLKNDGAPAEFSVLKEGMKVRVTAEKVGKRLNPKLVEILK